MLRTPHALPEAPRARRTPLLFPHRPSPEAPIVVAIVIVALLALLLMFGTSGPAARIARRIFGPALLLGGLGFVLGFFGPMILAPDANQGPMLGIFITGPMGFVLGLGIGVVRELMDRAR
ncbi:MAG: hypothetical protein WD960_04515 [Gemmatimonadota bacterium]